MTIEAIHVAQFVGLGVLIGYHGAIDEARRRRFIGMVSFVLGIGLLNEGLQGWIPQRCFQWSDVLLNWMGGLLGLCLCKATRSLTAHTMKRS